MRSCVFVLCLVGGIFSSVHAYKAGVVDASNKDISDVTTLILNAGEKNVDIVLLPMDISDTADNYDNTVKVLSKAAKQAALYLVAHLNENAICQKKREVIRSNIVFDRKGSVVAVYRKPTNSNANCSVSDAPVVFETDFGVTFDVLMEEDLVLKVPNLKNVIVAGGWQSEIPFLSASQFTTAWAYAANANVLSMNGIFAGRAGLKTGSESLIITDLKNNADESATTPPVVVPAGIKNFPVEDLSQYIFKPLNVEASSRGVKETVCHNEFCCEFNIKAKFIGSKYEANYGLAAFDGIRYFGGRHYIGTQICAVFACAGLYKKSCSIGSISNSTNMIFEKLTVTANFTADNSIQYPVIVTNERLESEKFQFHSKTSKNSKQTTIEIIDTKNLFAIGIFGRDFANDYEKSLENQDGGVFESLTEDLQELFDYLWIRIRVLLFVVSIYVLEMM